jgi:hypothetical protein
MSDHKTLLFKCERIDFEVRAHSETNYIDHQIGVVNEN